MARNKLIVVVHDGSFHPDEIFGVSVIKLCYESDFDIEVVRTRDQAKIEAADIVLDVGGEYDPNRRRFDHHQAEGAGKRANNIPYASFGLVWKEYGEKVAGSAEAAKMIDAKLVQPIDATDNGIDLYKTIFKAVHPYDLLDLLMLYRPSWRNSSNESLDQGFSKALVLATEVLRLEVSRTKDLLKAKEDLLKVYKKSKNKEILVFDARYPVSYFSDLLTRTKMVVYPKTDGMWAITTIRPDSHFYQSKTHFPKAWGGKRDQELATTTGVVDAVFCHRGLFFCVAKTKGGAVELAKKALKSK